LKKPLVSIITPCWNGEEYVARYFESILAQTYDCVEVIFVNDGSTDRTEEIALMYGDRLKNKGYGFTYIFQENSGQAAALNAGLKIFKGDYLTWPDSDDFLTPNSVENRVVFLEYNREFGFVRSDGYLYEESDLRRPKGFISGRNPNRFNDKLFDDLVLERTFVANGCYLVRTDELLKVNPNRKIHESRAGQNWQMLLPLSFSSRCGFIDEPLYCVVIRNRSHSRAYSTLKQQIERTYELKHLLEYVVFSLNVDVYEYQRIIEEKYSHRLLRLAGNYGDPALAKKSLQYLKKFGSVGRVDRLYYLMSLTPITRLLGKCIFRTKQLLAHKSRF